jgi:hypothetical protein
MAKLTHEFAILEQSLGAENEDDARPANFGGW